MGPLGCVRLSGPAVGCKSVRFQVRMARPVMPGDVLATISYLDPLGEARRASGHRTAPARVLVRQ
eukprot:8107326-Alexandrium_andersonii.AAC.1